MPTGCITRPFAQLLGTYEIKDTALHLDVQTRQLTGYETLTKQPLNWCTTDFRVEHWIAF